MITVLSWNIQCGRGVDGRVDLERIARVIRANGDPDLICLQEVASHMPELDGGAGGDQPAALARLFPGHEAVYGPALEVRDGEAGPYRRFGNLVLSRLPVRQIFRHLLPQPADPGLLHMPRQATEVVVAAASGPLRVITTHLEYHSARQRLAQILRLRELQQEAADNAARPPQAGTGPYAARPRPASCVLCGDLNCRPEDEAFRRLLDPLPDGLPGFRDAWSLAHGARPHAPTCGIFDRVQWPEGPHCRDFFLVAGDLEGKVADLRIDGETDASDHQPLLLTLRA